MPYRLADNVQVRKESWGLLFYHQQRHKVLFVKSGDWLYPEHFSGTWTYKTIVEDIAQRTGSTEESLKISLPKLTERLTKNRMLLIQ
jgi:putative mycofactocin binding protein MftB